MEYLCRLVGRRIFTPTRSSCKTLRFPEQQIPSCSYFCSNYICPFAYPLSILCINSQRISSLIILINRTRQVNGNTHKIILQIFMTFYQTNAGTLILVQHWEYEQKIYKNRVQWQIKLYLMCSKPIKPMFCQYQLYQKFTSPLFI